MTQRQLEQAGFFGKTPPLEQANYINERGEYVFIGNSMKFEHNIIAQDGSFLFASYDQPLGTCRLMTSEEPTDNSHYLGDSMTDQQELVIRIDAYFTAHGGKGSKQFAFTDR
ncbi:hypothetical protein PK28_04940 [Hymenobacter sp. DG25B]|uniref:hypothetical protein n=1 Tax=Hymenobacter sp. DG25B TaxID=1385664 RepID=UPI00054116CD|nr:hypothetical protein [Hymenobacter sp. DG25B]AIZ63197.1 hypothetical protein PK28_04940 [Hymenobacter sp. DG25B]